MSEQRRRYAKVHEIFGGAEGLHGVAREAYLAKECGADELLRRDVEAMLAVATERDGTDLFSDERLARSRQALERAVDGATDTWLPEHVGGYDILRQIGQGGMGVVYEAIQQSPRRSVAIKLLHPMHATDDRVRRFRREAELLGRLQHSGIAQIYEASTYDIGRGPQPFFAMELVAGVDIRTYCDRQSLGVRARLELLAEIADAVQYAHDSGVIHRDLKPDNVLVDERGRPRILDFGVARPTDDSAVLSTLLTQDGQLVGTLAYMAPEQLQQAGEELTSQVDVYGLGVLAFELLTHKLPRDVDDVPVSVAMKRIMETDVPAAGMLNPVLAGDVETILGKALEADLGRRYASAAAFADDLRRYLNSEPIQARPPSRIYLARKFARRNRSLVGGVVATLFVALVGTVIAIGYATDATRRADELERLLYRSSIGAASTAVQARDLMMAELHLDAAPAAHRGWEYDYLRARLVQHEREWPAPAAVVSDPVFDRDGQRMFAVMADGKVGTWDVATGQLTSTAAIQPSTVNLLTVQLDGTSRRYAALTDTGKAVVGSLVADGHQVLSVDGAQRFVWSADGEQLLICGDQTHVWRTGDLRRLTDSRSSYGAWSAAGDRVLLVDQRMVALHHVERAQLLATTEIDDIGQGAAFSPDGKTAAVACYYRKVVVMDGNDLSNPSSLSGHGDLVWQVAWTPGGRMITVSNDLSVRVWHQQPELGADVYRPDVQDGQWNPIQQVPAPLGRPKIAAMPAGDKVLVVGDRIRVLPIEDPAVIGRHDTYVYSVAFSADGAMLASSAFRESEVRVWDVAAGTLFRRLAASAQPPQHADAPQLCFCADGHRLVTVSDRVATSWHVRSGAKLSSYDVPDLRETFLAELGDRRLEAVRLRSVTASRDGSVAARVANGGGAVDVFLRASSVPEGRVDEINQELFVGEPTFQLTGHSSYVYCVKVSPDGTRIATGSNDATVAIWDAQTGERLLVLYGHKEYVMDLAWSPDGTMLASASGDNTVRLWDSLPLPERRAMAPISGK